MAISERVQRGIDLLNAKGSANWQKKIDLNRLNMRGSSDCILGQLYGRYFTGQDTINISQEKCVSCGFDSKEDLSSYVTLTQEWKEALSMNYESTVQPSTPAERHTTRNGKPLPRPSRRNPGVYQTTIIVLPSGRTLQFDEQDLHDLKNILRSS